MDTESAQSAWCFLRHRENCGAQAASRADRHGNGQSSQKTDIGFNRPSTACCKGDQQVFTIQLPLAIDLRNQLRTTRWALG